MTEILRMYRGDDRTFTITVAFDGVVTDLSAVVDIRFTAKRQWYDSDADAPIALSLFNGVEYVTDGMDGALEVSIPSASTMGMGAGTVLLWDLEVEGILTSGGPSGIRTWPEAAGIPQPGKLVVVGDVSGAPAS